MEEGNAENSISKVLDMSYEPNLAIGKGYSIPDDTEELNLTNNQVKEIENLAQCAKLKTLVLRQNAIKELKNLENLGELVDLDLFMNEIKHIGENSLKNKDKLEKLDLSFNKVKDLDEFRLAKLPALKEIYLIHNKIGKIEGLDHLTTIEFLELGDNHLKV